MDGNEATALSAFRTNELCVIYPITPSSNMGEYADAWSAKKQENIWGTVPQVVEMQSEGGASGAVHGALQTGALTTTFTASQGLLLMLPNMYKIAGELTSTVFHVAARSLAAQALSIFGDHSDVMAARQTGFAMLASSSVQEAHDMALIAQAATLKARVPFLHFFDGFRTSHEETKIELISDEIIRQMIDDELVIAHRQRALNSEKPILRGTAQNPDVYFQGRETVNPYYEKTPAIVEEMMQHFEKLTGRRYATVNYYGAKDAERIIVIMGSGAETVHDTVDYLIAKGEKVGLLHIRLFRPFPSSRIVKALPATVKSMVVLDRTKEPGSAGEPLYQDILTALAEAQLTSKIHVIGGRYGLSSKEFTPAMVKALFEEASKAEPKNHFTIGINDDVTHTSIDYDATFNIEPKENICAMFFGLGADGTVSANKNSIKIIGEETDAYAQGYFVYDSKKAGAKTVSHLRFGPKPIRAPYLVQSANFIACHQFNFLETIDVLANAKEGATFLLNAPFETDKVWDQLPRCVQQSIIDKKLKFYVIDAYQVAKDAGMGTLINTIMQTCFFAISNVLPQAEAIEKIKRALKKSYGHKGEAIIEKNLNAVDMAISHLHEIKVPETATSTVECPPIVSDKAPEFVQKVTAKMMAQKGDELKVSELPDDGTYPTGTTQWEKRNIAQMVPCWDPETCIQCGTCSLVCPHAVIRSKRYDKALLANAPEKFKSVATKDKNFADKIFTLQVYPEDCTGCNVCTVACPAKNKQDPNRKAINMEPKAPILEEEKKNVEFFETLPDNDRKELNTSVAKDIQFLQPLFEFSGACAGCGETPYVKLVSQLFGDRMIVANATGCSSIYGGNLPTTPWTVNKEGRGPAWSNSLFEDNAEFGLGFRLTQNKHAQHAAELLNVLADKIGDSDLVNGLLNSAQTTEAEIELQRSRVAKLQSALTKINDPKAKLLSSLANHFVKHSIWIMGGDGWAYDIGFGGLDHVLASGKNVNILVLDTMVYSNTGGQSSKATPRAAVAKFAAGGKSVPKKDLGLMMTTYGYIYVAQIALDANPRQAIQAIKEAEAYDGPSLILAYCQCIAHGFKMDLGIQQQKLAVQSGFWPLYRYNPDKREQGENPMQIDSAKPSIELKTYMENEMRFKLLNKVNPEDADLLLKEAQDDVNRRWELLEKFAGDKK